LKNKISILLFAVYLFTATNFLEFFKLPLLVEHFIEHKYLDKDLGVIDFMVIHYFSKLVIDEDYEKDAKLPFKSDNTCTSCNISHVYNFQNNKIEIQEIFHEISVNTYFLLKDDFSISQNHQSIWQPPKFS
jgi:hypothetical protein